MVKLPVRWFRGHDIPHSPDAHKASRAKRAERAGGRHKQNAEWIRGIASEHRWGLSPGPSADDSRTPVLLRRVTLKEQLDRADAARNSAWDAIVGPITIIDTRSQILLSYASIALEHQEAIVMLARHGLSGSAFALVRPLFEILYRAAGCVPARSLTRWTGSKSVNSRFLR
jgi:hypothetical protein